MVSTTLSTLAAGQSSLTSSENRQHQLQQHSAQSTSTAGTAITTAINSNYQRSISQQHNSLTTTNVIGAQRNSNNHYYNTLAANGFGSNTNNNNHEKNNNKSIYDTEYNHNLKQHKENFSIIASNGANLTPLPTERTTPITINENDETTKSTSNTKLKETSSTLVNLKETLSTSPPVDDHISLLFPKCRPKQVNTSTETAENITLKNSFYSSNGNEQEQTDLLLLSDGAECEGMNKTQIGAPRLSTSNYYKNVNIITQSPPPHSTSSVSSESLSSVTPRISTNPFLSSDIGKYQEQTIEETQEQPINPYFNQFYYSADMPRKRVAYNPSYVGTPSEEAICSSSNPFLKDNYWEAEESKNNCRLEEGCSTEVESLRAQSVALTNQRTNAHHGFGNANYTTRISTQTAKRASGRSGPRYDEQRKYEMMPPVKRSFHHSPHYATLPGGTYGYGNKNYMDRYGNEAMNCWENSEKTMDADYECDRELKVYGDRGRDRYRRREWVLEHEPLRIRDWERDNLRNWESERDYERRREHDRERHYDHERERDRERERIRYREQDEIVERIRKHEREITYEMQDREKRKNQQQDERQQQTQVIKKPTYSIIGNGEMVVFDDFAETWKNLKVTPEMILSKTSSSSLEKDRSPKENNEIVVQEHKNIAGKNSTMSLEARHGIIEYEGSPRRIGQPGNTIHMEATPHTNKISDSKPSKQIQHLNSVSSPLLPARPGFPKRIVSPTRDYANQQLSQQTKTQQRHSQSLQQQSLTDNNAEDTSNDVSEIGTISDLTIPEAISAKKAINAEAMASVSEAIPITQTALSSIYAPSTSYASTNEDNNTLKNSVGEAAATAATSAANSVSVATIVPTTSSNTTTVSNAQNIPTKSTTFDYLYEFSETRKVLEEFFKCPSNDEKPLENSSDVDSIDIQYEFHSNNVDLNGLGKNNNNNMQATEEEDADAEDVADDNNDLYETKNFKHLSHQQQQQQHQKKIVYNGEKHTSKHHQRRHFTGSPLMRSFDFFLDSVSRSSGEQIDMQESGNKKKPSKKTQNCNYSPDTTDYDSNCGDLESLSGDINGISNNCSNHNKYYETTILRNDNTALSDHSTDSESNMAIENNNHMQEKSTLNTIHRTSPRGGISMLMDSQHTKNNCSTFVTATNVENVSQNDYINKRNSLTSHTKLDSSVSSYSPSQNDFAQSSEQMLTNRVQRDDNVTYDTRDAQNTMIKTNNSINNKVFKNIDPELDSLYSINVFQRSDMMQMTPPPPAPAPHRKPSVQNVEKEILQQTPYVESRPTSSTNTTINPTSTLNRNKNLVTIAAANRAGHPPPIPERNLAHEPSTVLNSPVWLPRHADYSANKCLLEPQTEIKVKNLSADEDDIDTDLETDRLLGHQRLDDQGYYDENKSWETRKTRSSLLSKISPKQHSCSKTHRGYNALLSSTPELAAVPQKHGVAKGRDRDCSISSSDRSDKSPHKNSHHLDVRDDFVVPTVNSPGGGSVGSGCISGVGVMGGGNGSIGSNGNTFKKDNELLESNNNSQNGSGLGSSIGHGGGGSLGSQTTSASGEKKVKKMLIEGVLFRAKYLGSTQLVCEGQPTKSTRMMQAEEAVSRIKALAPDGDAQPSTEVDLFISTEKIMVLNTDLKEIMMDHALRTISYIADIGDLVVLMARRRFVPQDIDDAPKPNRTPKMICHVFESDEAQFIAQSIGQAFQVAYMEFLKANGIEDHSFVKEMDYQEVLNSQEIFGDELEIFAKKELQKEVVVPKAKGEILGVVIVESGWGSMLPTVVIANLMSSGAAARCGQLNIGDQLIAINGLSLVGLPLSTCQSYIKNTKNQTVVKFTVVPCAPVVEVKIKRPNTKYQLGFSVQNGVICSLLRGGIAERGGVRVGHRIIEINNQSVVAVPHEKIVNLLATSVGEILMKTMPTSMFRLLTGQENPIYI